MVDLTFQHRKQCCRSHGESPCTSILPSMCMWLRVGGEDVNLCFQERLLKLIFGFKLHECLVGVKTHSSVWLQLLLKPVKWKQEHRGHAQRKDFTPPRLLFCYLGKAAFIGKVPVSHPEPFFRLYCWEGEVKHNRYPEPSAGLQVQPRLLLHIHPVSPSGLRLLWD